MRLDLKLRTPNLRTPNTRRARKQDCASEKKKHMPSHFVHQQSSEGASAEQNCPGSFGIGCCVSIAGLQRAGHLNGKPGVCKKWDEEKERWQVELATGETKLVKAANLIVDMRPSAPQSPPELEDTKPDGPTQYED